MILYKICFNPFNKNRLIFMKSYDLTTDDIQEAVIC